MSASVFPAYVGMSPKMKPAAAYMIGVPRIRGDEPHQDSALSRFDTCSPHTWG